MKTSAKKCTKKSKQTKKQNAPPKKNGQTGPQDKW